MNPAAQPLHGSYSRNLLHFRSQMLTQFHFQPDPGHIQYQERIENGTRFQEIGLPLRPRMAQRARGLTYIAKHQTPHTYYGELPCLQGDNSSEEKKVG